MDDSPKREKKGRRISGEDDGKYIEKVYSGSIFEVVSEGGVAEYGERRRCYSEG